MALPGMEHSFCTGALLLPLVLAPDVDAAWLAMVARFAGPSAVLTGRACSGWMQARAGGCAQGLVLAGGSGWLACTLGADGRAREYSVLTCVPDSAGVSEALQRPSQSDAMPLLAALAGASHLALACALFLRPLALQRVALQQRSALFAVRALGRPGDGK